MKRSTNASCAVGPNCLHYFYYANIYTIIILMKHQSLLIKVVTAPKQPCHNTRTTLSQHQNNLVTTPKQPCHSTKTTLSQHQNNLVTTPKQPCHNTKTTLSQHQKNLVTTPKQPCHNTKTTLIQIKKDHSKSRLLASAYYLS